MDTDDVLAEGVIEDSPVRLTVRRNLGGYTWALTVPVGSLDLEGYKTAIRLAAEVDDELTATFGGRITARQTEARSVAASLRTSA